MTTKGNATPHYSFPLLKPSEIIAFVIRDMRVPVTEDDVRNCDVAAIRKVHEAFLEKLMGVSVTDMSQLQFHGLQQLAFPELHEESAPELHFFRKISKLMLSAGITDFGLKDIVTPTPKRVRRQLSALINFGRYRDERVETFLPMTQEADALKAHKQSLLDERAALERQLAELQSEQVAEEPAIRQLTDDNAALEAEINALNKRQAVMRHETSEIKAKYQELKDEMASYAFNLIEADKQTSELQSKIVNSPDRVKQELRGIAHNLEGAKEEHATMERKLRELQMISDTFARSEKDMLKILELMEEIEGDMKKCKDAKEEVKAQTKEIEENRRKALELVSQRKRLEKLAEQKREHFEHYKDESKIKDQAADQALKAAQEELAQLESAHGNARQRIAAAKDAARELERKLREDELRFQRDLQELQQSYARVQIAAQHYNAELLDAIRTK